MNYRLTAGILNLYAAPTWQSGPDAARRELLGLLSTP